MEKNLDITNQFPQSLGTSLNRGSTVLTVVDYMRQFKNLSYTVIEPVFPEVGDMVLIQGESHEDIWHGHIQNVDFINKTVDVYFYVPSLRFPNGNVYVRESRGGGTRNTVAWRSVISFAEGDWNNASTWIKTTKRYGFL